MIPRANLSACSGTKTESTGERPGQLPTLISSLVSRGQATFSFHFLTKQVMERPERLSWESYHMESLILPESEV